MGRGRGLRAIVTLVVTLSWVLAPPPRVVQAPPAAANTSLTVPLGSGPSRPIHVPDLVAVSAVLDGRALEVRWRGPDGAWSPWVPFPPPGEHAPDPGTWEARTARDDVSDPVWVASDTVQVRADAPGAVVVDALTMRGSLAYRPSADDAPVAHAAAMWPPIVPRDVWDPEGQCERDGPVRTVGPVERIFVHHTAVFPAYPAEAGDDVVRAICLFHTGRRGFADIGYNYLIDRYGVIYQGRAGGILRDVVGAHAQGFNHESVGIALVGNFQRDKVPPAAAHALDRLTAWLADLHGIDPTAVTPHVSTGGPSTRYGAGEVVDLPTIVGHRDTGLDTRCPGDHLYAIVRGPRPIAPRVRQILTTEYGWPQPPA